MGLNLEYTDGQTLLSEQEREGLRIPSITTIGDLDEFEQQNIQAAIEWTLTHRFKAERILTEKFIRDLHKRMYNDVWRWAGTFRRSEKNMGVPWPTIPVALNQLLTDGAYWMDHETFDPDEIAIRLKHRVVQIHCFANGNGRHSRLLADILISHVYRKPVFTWGSASLRKPNEARTEYISALHQADRGDFDLLMQFSRS